MDTGRIVECPCCGGAGEHEVQRYVRASPWDYLLPCEFCLSEGTVPANRARQYRGKCR